MTVRWRSPLDHCLPSHPIIGSIEAVRDDMGNINEIPTSYTGKCLNCKAGSSAKGKPASTVEKWAQNSGISPARWSCRPSGLLHPR